MLNPFRRALRLPGRLGARLITGTEKVRCGYGNGDCLLVDCRHGVFAVADATERFPQASRRLLGQLAHAVCLNGPPGDELEFKGLLERIWSRQKYIHRTTLSCVVVVPHGGGAIMVANNGDSSVTLVSPDDGRLLFRSGADMNFAGRSQHPNPVSTLAMSGVPPLTLLATDGAGKVAERLDRALLKTPYRIVERLTGQRQSGHGETDDMGVIALATRDRVADTGESVIMGGTRPGVESAFGRRTGEMAALDRWDELAAWKHHPEGLARAGIQIF
ncbi:hypothetical protein DSCA_16280 [Desulfosarcina alkanivorans]|uniref:PPM-type phosphatase domain-containing protein n=1 Tax=Desulfosarcina alkanivorans TaxID=571177 RepID=A0A5K7YF55_9BACT|nr:hypothetical protein [Desulfosarcina alkanivorans]BBO67698.1 hypothetical protein DSCA_16280 [Desulfosarcina alkanivorans]